jgi:predicted Rossmann fold nucleotide-binding protein DprA/Smf involved in DNA uptake
MDVAFALALLRLDGVGRVTAHRLLERFPSYEALRMHPREQVLVRLKGLPRAEQIVAMLFDERAMQAALRQAQDERDQLSERQIDVLAPGHPNWPSGLDRLAPSDRPVALFAFGTAALLTTQPTAFFARPPLPAAPFETAQTLARRLIAEGLPFTCGARPGFDVVLHKLAAGAAHPSVLVARAGLAQIDAPARPSVAASVRAGGVLVSPFPIRHGPFEHDDNERALVQVALAGPSTFFAPGEDTPEARALSWALDHEQAVFGLADDTGAASDDALPSRVHRLARPVDLDWVIATARGISP